MAFVKQGLRDTTSPQYLARNERIREAQLARWGSGEEYTSSLKLRTELGMLMYGRVMSRGELTKYVMGEDPLVRLPNKRRPVFWQGKHYPSVSAAAKATGIPYHIVKGETRYD